LRLRFFVYLSKGVYLEAKGNGGRKFSGYEYFFCKVDKYPESIIVT
jgi:hypothetical protein